MVANALAIGSYVSCQSALAFYGLIPEGVKKTICICHTRTNHWQTPFGEYWFHYVTVRLMNGYQLIDLPEGGKAFIALPEKALLDLIHLQPGADDPFYIQELRLQHFEILNLERLQSMAEKYKSPKLVRASEIVSR